MPETEVMATPTRIHIAYDGPALETHRMDVKDLAPALLALSELVERANELLNENRARVRVQVRGSFKSGSFGVDIEVLQSLGQWVVTLLNHPTLVGTLNLTALLGLLGGKGALSLIKRLRGRELEVISLREDGSAEVLIDGEHAVVEEQVLRLLRDHKVRLCFEQLIAKPLGNEGINSFAVVDTERKEVLVHVNDNEARYFVAPAPVSLDEIVNEYDARVQVVGLSFVEGNKWRFSDGQNAYMAAIVDPDFNERVALRQEQFGYGDVLHVRLRQRQVIINGKLRADYEIVRVYSHHKQPPVEQPNLPLPPPTDPQL